MNGNGKLQCARKINHNSGILRYFVELTGLILG